MVTTHELRHASVLWAFAYATVRRNGAAARRMKISPAASVGTMDVKEALIDIFEQVDFLLTKNEDGLCEQEDDEICELWHYTADHWNIDDHDALVERLMEIGAVPEHATVDRHAGSVLTQAAQLRAAELRQADLGAVVAESLLLEDEVVGSW